MNETINILLNRYSLRSFSDKKIAQEIQTKILEAAQHAASAGNLQPVSIIKIEEKSNANWFVEQGMQKFIGEAPLNLLFCLDFHRIKKWSEYHKAPFVMDKSFRHFWVGFQDVIIAAQSIETAGNSFGIGSVYIGTTIDKILEIQKKFSLPKGVIPIVLLSMGYPKTEGKIAKKLPIEIFVHSEKYQNQDIEEIVNAYKLKYGDPIIPLTDDNKNKILQVIYEVDGIDTKNETELFLNTLDKISTPMRYFGLHYQANFMAKHNTDVLDILYKNGLIWSHQENHPKQ